ncbi:SDR family oxidoreductase [Tengunoibacter tsumagoiensis]|uniref:3-ketoacyl-ACP reductase n=1 Tax=Tengunoibacter tsumagoiensis TaxID=2014871 RepID=A0A402A6C0_9CHLR|nr:SDR family NAD(P)-dependent oxidoreductase [Tengunoibacter tsumagoiensis]GCE14678.1 3-ketoacyl-ACP reductase [Tengunoibacter tsumagoiensis]
MTSTSKVALITGAGSGIGKATAHLLAKQGIRIVALSRTATEVEKTATEIQHEGGEAMALVADVANEAQIIQAMQTIIDTWGRLDIVFANAGINGVWTSIENLSLDDWNRTITINLTGTFLTIKYAVPHLKKQGGNILINSSINGTRIFSNTGATAYSTTKAGQVAMAKMLAVELARHHIRVNVICPGETRTEIQHNTELKNMHEIQFPVHYPVGNIPFGEGKPAESNDVAELAAFLMSDSARHITGSEIYIDGASSLVKG